MPGVYPLLTGLLIDSPNDSENHAGDSPATEKHLITRQKISQKPLRLGVKSVALLCMLVQTIAVPAQFASHPEASHDALAEVAECPAHATAAEHAAHTEDCECDDGSCCELVQTRLPVSLLAHTELFRPEKNSVSATDAATDRDFNPLIQSAHSRAPPLTHA